MSLLRDLKICFPEASVFIENKDIYHEAMFENVKSKRFIEKLVSVPES